MASFRIDRTLPVSVIIAQYARHELTERVLERIRRFEPAAVQLIVVDDGSPEAVPDDWERRFNLRVLRQEHRGTTAAWNGGAAAASGDVLVFLNNDVEVGGPFLDRLAAPLADKTCRMTGVAFRKEKSVPPELLTAGRANVLEGWCFALRAKTLREAGGFDPRFRLYFSDTDLQWRIVGRESNFRSLQMVSGLPLVHTAHATTRRCPERRAIWERDRTAFVRKWRAPVNVDEEPGISTQQRNSPEPRRIPQRQPAPVVHPRSGRPFHLLQVCNVGTVLGGTGACAWTVTRALSDWRHSVVFFSPVDAETSRALEPADVYRRKSIERKEIGRWKPDLILMHNTPASHVETPSLPVPCINYLHSRRYLHDPPFPGDRLVCASRWLKDCPSPLKRASVLYQAVPAPPRFDPSMSKRGRNVPRRSLRDDLTVGRLCTPTSAKWPATLPRWYRNLAGELPGIRWEFVGCPEGMQAELRRACGGRAVFHPPGISARAHLWNWDALVYHHPTLTESFGRTCAEAMRAGCIPVVDDRGGFREQVVDGTGILCGSDDEFQAALTLLDDPGERMRRSRHSRAYADETFGLAAFRAALLEEFAALVN